VARVTNQGPAAVRKALDTANSGDTDRFLDCFGESGSVNDWGRVFTGREAIRGWSDSEFIGVNVSLDVLDVTTTGDTTVITAQVGGSGFNGPSHFAFTVQDDLIAVMRITA
jgi:SnoaL-like domain